jgi:hypothetical protein
MQTLVQKLFTKRVAPSDGRRLHELRGLHSSVPAFSTPYSVSSDLQRSTRGLLYAQQARGNIGLLKVSTKKLVLG